MYSGFNLITAGEKVFWKITHTCNAFYAFYYLKWYYDQKISTFFSSDFESVFLNIQLAKFLSFVFYPKAV